MAYSLETIKALRAASGLTQEKFAEKYNIPKRTIENWETGKRIPPDYLVELLSKVVDLDRINATPMAYVLTEYRDKAGTGTTTFLGTDENEAILAARKIWEDKNEADRESYDFENADWFYCGLFRLWWDGVGLEWCVENDPITVAYDAERE